MKQLQLAAILISWLVITLPVVAAQQLDVERFSGKDLVEGFAKENDELTIVVTAQMIGGPSPEVAAKRLRVYYGDTFEFFDECAPVGQAMYDCQYSTTELIYAGVDQYTIRLYDNAEPPNVIEETTEELTVDIMSPEFTLFNVQPDSTKAAQAVTITYEAEDYGRQTGLTEDCAGIRNLTINADQDNIHLSTGIVGECDKSANFQYNPSSSEGFKLIKICAIATDYLGHTSAPECKDLRFDSVAPNIESMKLTDTSGFTVSHIKTGQVANVNVVVTIRGNENDVDEETVFADLNNLNPALLTRKHDSRIGDNYIWKNVAVTSPSSCEITVRANDFLGNDAEKTLTCSLPIDDTGPATTFLGTAFNDEDDTPLIGVEGTIIARFTEEGSGMDRADAFLDLSNLGLSPIKKADECKANGETWECKWTVSPVVQSGDYSIKVLGSTKDDIGNLLGTPTTKTIRFDKTAPIAPILMGIFAFRDQQRVPTNATFLSETIEFLLRAGDFEDAFADFSQLGGSNSTPVEYCEGNQTKNCTFGITVAVSGPVQALIPFTFSDKAGNTAGIAVPITVLAVANETEPNFWTSTVACSPKNLDRSTLSIYDHPAYCHITLHSANPNAETLTVQGPVDPTECSGQIEWLSDISTSNNQPGTKEPFIGMTFVAADYGEFEKLTVTCPIKILTRVGQFVTSHPETENITMSLTLYNNPLGEAYKNVEDEIEDVKDKVEGVWDVIGKLNKIFGYVEKLCQILNTIAKLLVLLARINQVIGIIGEVVQLIPGVGSAIKEALDKVQINICKPEEEIAQIYKNELFETLKPFCDFVTCEQGLFDLLGDSGDDTTSKDGTGVIAGVYGEGAEIKTKEQGGYSNPDQYLNVKDSLVMSIIIPPLCIPGIIYNLDKWRQIECRYGLCLAQDVKEAGIPIRACKDQKSYMQCRFVVGEIFNLIPFAPLVDYYINLYKRLAEDPLVLASSVVGEIANCKQNCEDKSAGIWHFLCQGLAIVSNLGDTVKTIKGIKTVADFGTVNQQWCEEFEDVVD